MKKRRMYFAAILLLLWANGLLSQERGDALYNNNVLHTIRITAPGLTLDAMYKSFLKERDSLGRYVYFDVAANIDGVALLHVGARIKGQVTAFDPKRPLKLDLNRFVKGQEYDGVTKINIHQGWMEKSYVREMLAYNIMRKAGVPASRTSPCRVYFNDKYIGLYTLVEQVNKNFLKDKYSSKKGLLLKKVLQEWEVKSGKGRQEDLLDILADIPNIPVDALDEMLPDIIDVDRFLSLMAVEVLIEARDDILDNNKDYYLYRPYKGSVIHYIPWDLNICFYLRKDSPGYDLIPERNSQPVFKHILKNEALKQRYMKILCRMLANNFTEKRLFGLIDRYEALIREAVAEDPYVPTTEQIADVKRIIRTRIAHITKQLSQRQVDCSLPEVEGGQLVINELVTSQDSLGGFADPAGDYPDWVELYNNGSSPVDLSDYYLSVDKHFLKLWAFPEGQTIGPHAYLVVWADREPYESGLHSVFKLAKSGGALYLSNSIDEIVDTITYDSQRTNIAYARIPNGTGPFRFTKPTPLARNEYTLATQGPPESNKITLHPNPVKRGGQLALDITGSSEEKWGRCTWITLAGHILSEWSIPMDREKVPVPLLPSFSSAGVYLFKIQSDDQVIVQKVVVY